MTIYLKTTSSNINQNDGMIKILKILKSSNIFLTMKMTFSLNKCWQRVRLYIGEFVKKNKSIKDNFTVTSSNFSRDIGLFYLFF